jgi:hypothetical protein
VRARLIASAAVLAMILAVLLLRGPGPGASARPPERRAAMPAKPLSRAPDPDLPWPARDPFRYADERTAGESPPRPLNPVAPPSVGSSPSPAASANPLRFIGLVRTGRTLKAALSMWGETVVLGEGEEARGYRVLSVDEESGVRLKQPDGSELSLAPSSSS